MKEEVTHIKILLERFFEGQTSNAEEQELYHFFSRADIPEELIQYLPVIKYFESGFADEFGMIGQTDERPESLTPAKNVLPHPASQAKPSKRKLWITWGGVAASFLLVLFSSIYFLTTKEPLDPYAGSYIIRNGVRITDLDLIRPELEAAIQKSILLEQEADRLIERLTAIDDSQEAQIMQQLQEHNQRILDNIQDENIRNELVEFLYPNL